MFITDQKKSAFQRAIAEKKRSVKFLLEFCLNASEVTRFRSLASTYFFDGCRPLVNGEKSKRRLNLGKAAIRNWANPKRNEGTPDDRRQIKSLTSIIKEGTILQGLRGIERDVPGKPILEIGWRGTRDCQKVPLKRA